ncbi:MAG: helix-turn-helix transcriptional regulator [Phycisphaeraceae bacterium]|nr:helix-turn-helix transcriptional regulator [Phycisphaeraceae bacterium]
MKMDAGRTTLHNIVTMLADDLIFLHGNHRPACIATVDKRFTYHSLQLMTRGSVRIRYDQRETVMRGTWIWPCMPGPWIYFQEHPPDQAWDHRYIAYTGPRAATWEAMGLILREPTPLTRREARRWTPMFDAMLDHAHRPGAWSHLRAVNLLEGLLLELSESRRQVAQRTHPVWLMETLEQLADLRHEPDYDAMAAARGMSPSTFQRQFRRATGSTPHLCRIRHRMAEAQRLLGETNRPIKRIADELGYRDVFYFSRQFRKTFGVTPGAYRKSRQL